MGSLILIVWGVFWTLAFGVAAQLFHVDLLVVNVPIAMATYCAARRRPITAYGVVFAVGWFGALLSGGARGPVLLAYLIVSGLLVFSRNRLRTHTHLRLAGAVVAASMLWSVVFCIILVMVGAGGWWKPLIQVSPLSAAMTGVFALFNHAVLSRIDPVQRLEIAGDSPLRAR